eukprot:3352327-Pyramimonas_sp.AAC.1
MDGAGQALVPGQKRKDLELRKEALDEWAGFTLRGTEEVDFDMFKTMVLQLAEIYAPKLNEASTRTHAVLRGRGVLRFDL